MYKLINNFNGETTSIIKDNILSIPTDPNNTDYQAYLKWLSEGGVPLPADEVTE